MPYLKKVPENRKDWQVYALMIKLYSPGRPALLCFRVMYTPPTQFAATWPLPPLEDSFCKVRMEPHLLRSPWVSGTVGANVYGVLINFPSREV